jgi:two-component system chemotaxis response regulator CheV
MEVLIDGQSYGVNVLKIKEVMILDKKCITRLPENQSHPSLVGMYRFRDLVMPLIDLAHEISDKERGNSECSFEKRQVILITEFNNKLNGFLIDEAVRIHKLSWEQIKPPSNYILQRGSRITGITHIKREQHLEENLFDCSDEITEEEEIQVLILDMEQILESIFPDYAMSTESSTFDDHENSIRENKIIAIAEDSNLIRNMMKARLIEAGYKEVKVFGDGQEALEAWLSHKKKQNNDIFADLLITDIEMPRMDGLTLCKRLKKEQTFPSPVVIFSSLINEQISLKCDEVGADAYRSKPKIDELIQVIDNLMKKLT